MSELSPPGGSEGYEACGSDCYSFITTPGNLLQSILGFAKMQNVEHHRSTESRYRYGYWLATVCAPEGPAAGGVPQNQMPNGLTRR